MDFHDHIISDSKVMLGKPVIKGTRITVELILQLLSEGAGVADISTMYPHLKEDDILAAIMYAQAVIATEETVDA